MKENQWDKVINPTSEQIAELFKKSNKQKNTEDTEDKNIRVRRKVKNPQSWQLTNEIKHIIEQGFML